MNCNTLLIFFFVEVKKVFQTENTEGPKKKTQSSPDLNGCRATQASRGLKNFNK
jgi:hypothetical protein